MRQWWWIVLTMLSLGSQKERKHERMKERKKERKNEWIKDPKPVMRSPRQCYQQTWVQTELIQNTQPLQTWWYRSMSSFRSSMRWSKLAFSSIHVRSYCLQLIGQDIKKTICMNHQTNPKWGKRSFKFIQIHSNSFRLLEDFGQFSNNET